MLILVRHGESTGNADGLLLGRMDAALTERGLAQARTLGPWVAGASRVISSPLARARDTAEALGTGLPVEIDPRWIEVDYGEFDGRPLGAVPAEVWTRWRADPDYRPPGGESLCEAGSRVRSACEELFSTDGAGLAALGRSSWSAMSLRSRRPPVGLSASATRVRGASTWLRPP
jgi:probable phosphoglycerate mutase